MIRKSWKKSILAALLIATSSSLVAQDDINGFVQNKPIVRTEADVEKGRENVKAVYQELQRLFDTPSDVLSYRGKYVEDEPRFVEIPDKDGKTAMIYFCRNTTASELARTLDALCSNNGYVEYSKEQNKILIVDDSDRMDIFKKAVVSLDQISPQVLIEAKVIEVLVADNMQRNLSIGVNNRQSGFDSSGEDSELVSNAGSLLNNIGTSSSDTGGVFNWYPYSGSDTNISVMFQWLQGAQDARVLSAPNIVISRGDTATINTGQAIPIQEQSQNGTSISFSTEYRDIGVTMRVTPNIINNKSVLLNVCPEVSNILQYETIEASGVSYQVPIISIRNIDTNLTLFDGQVIMMGGLFNAREVISEERTPFLSDMPWIGELFTAKSTTNEVVQLLFVLRVTILNAEELESGVVYNPAQASDEIEEMGKILREDPYFDQFDKTTVESVKEELKSARGMRDFQDALNDEDAETSESEE